jgi:hypothetical protein
VERATRVARGAFAEGGNDIMSISNVKALFLDNGGTILDWHIGVRTAFAAVGARHGFERDWAKLANKFRRRSHWCPVKK